MRGSLMFIATHRDPTGKQKLNKFKRMKTYTFKMILLVGILFFCQMMVKAEDVKKLHKSWPVNRVTSLSVENKFGNINFLNSRDDSVTIDVSIETEDDNYRNNSRIANMIDFEFSFEEGEIKAHTIFDNDFKTNKDFTINYVINIPVNKNLNVSNKFGNVTLTDLKANGKFEISYGNIFGNSMIAPFGSVFQLDLKYGNATFETINRLNAKISYSKLRTTKLETGELDTKYSSINFDNCKTLNSNSQYDNFIIGTLQYLSTDSKFTGWKIDEIVNNAEFNTEYGDVNVGHVSRDFQNIRIENRYGNIKIGIDKDATYNLNSDTYYCELRHPKTSPTKYLKDNNHTIIEAKIGNGNQISKVIIESKYGNIDLMK
jgi:hypothetical protein